MANNLEEQKPMPTDMNEDEKAQLEMFVTNGCVGMSKIKDSDVFQWFELYMLGNSYSEIAIATRKKKEYILFMAYKQDWFDKKMAHFNHLLQNVQEKLTQTKLESINTLSTIIGALGKHYNEKFTRYMTTKDETILDGIDTKMLSQYYKSMESLEKLMGKAAGDGEGKGPLVNFNLQEGATIEQLDDNTVEVTSKTAGDLLKMLASAKKEESKDKK